MQVINFDCKTLLLKHCEMNQLPEACPSHHPPWNKPPWDVSLHLPCATVFASSQPQMLSRKTDPISIDTIMVELPAGDSRDSAMSLRDFLENTNTNGFILFKNNEIVIEEYFSKFKTK
jgi:hypothetical protein